MMGMVWIQSYKIGFSAFQIDPESLPDHFPTSFYSFEYVLEPFLKGWVDKSPNHLESNEYSQFPLQGIPYFPFEGSREVSVSTKRVVHLSWHLGSFSVSSNWLNCLFPNLWEWSACILHTPKEKYAPGVGPFYYKKRRFYYKNIKKNF